MVNRDMARVGQKIEEDSPFHHIIGVEDALFLISMLKGMGKRTYT